MADKDRVSRKGKKRTRANNRRGDSGAIPREGGARPSRTREGSEVDYGKVFVYEVSHEQRGRPWTRPERRGSGAAGRSRRKKKLVEFTVTAEKKTASFFDDVRGERVRRRAAKVDNRKGVVGVTAALPRRGKAIVLRIS